MKKYYRVVAKVDLDAMRHNIHELRKVLRPESKIMAVIKADGYGHGAIPLARDLIDNGVYHFAVSTLEEGIALRRSGIDYPILIMGYTPVDNYESLITYDLTQTVFKLSMGESLSQAALNQNKKARVHIKVDTGMGRVGFLSNDSSIETVCQIASMPQLFVEGIYTHFAKADESDKTYTKEQLSKFTYFIKALEKRGVHIPIKHASNSAGLMDVPHGHFDFVRAGISLYGLYPSEEVNHDVSLKPVLSLVSHIVMIKKVESGTKISYGGTFETSKPSRIATIPVGYGDGYPRTLSSKGRVLIRGKYAPIIGRICMDQMMVDITHVQDAKDGDEVVIIGQQGGHSITTDEIAKLTHTINYEIVCQLGKRIPRVYFKNNLWADSIDYFDV